MDWGIDHGKRDETVQVVCGCDFLCEVPMDLGQVTALVERGGKLIAETESGIQFILPTHRRENDEELH